MATKHQLITGLYEHTISNVTDNTKTWTAFLRSACRNYKCRFDEQILIYAQRPDATAVLECEKWNKQFGRWVNKGAKGIAVFDDEHNHGYRLKHYFDVSDTHGSRFERSVPIWSMKPEFEEEVIESLENSFGELDDKSTFADAIISVAKNAVEDNITDYLRDLMYSRDDSFLESLDELNVEVEYRNTLQSSIAYMMMVRCGIDADYYFEFEDFRHLSDFNTPQTVNALGLAASDIAENCLREIAATVQNLQKENRTFAKPEQSEHNVPTIQTEEKEEGSAEHDRSLNIQSGERLPRTESGIAGGRERKSWQVRVTPKEISETEPQNIVREPADVGQAERTPDGDRQDGDGTHGIIDGADGGDRGRDGGIESPRPNEMGGLNEQHSPERGRNDTERPNLLLKPLPTVSEQLSLIGEAEEEKSSAFSISQQIIDEVLTSGGNEENSVHRIAAYFKKDYPTAENAEFLKKEYRTGGKGFIFDGKHVSIWFDESGIRIATGDTVLTNKATLVTWEQAAKRTRELLDMGRYMPQSELDKVDGYEIKVLADELWYLERDLEDDVEFSFIDKELFRSGFPDSTARIAELLAQPEQREIILEGIKVFADEYRQNPSLLRFPYSANYLRKVLEGLSGFQREPLVFAADETVSTARPAFITQDEIDRVLAGGSNIEGGKYRIYSFFLQNHTAKEKVDFLKDEYGTGGSSRTGFSEWHDSKGISYSRENNYMPYDKILLPWSKVAKRIDELVADGRFMSKAQLAHLPEYEKGVLAAEIYHFYYNQPEEVPRPYPTDADYYAGVKAVRPQLDEPERVAEILSTMAVVLDNTADFARNYESMQKAFRDLTAYQNGTFSLFTPDKAIAEKITAKAKQAQAKQAKSAPEPSATPNSVVSPAAKPAQAPSDFFPIPTEYDLQLGATVYLGIEEFELNAIDDTHVVLRDLSAPLFTLDMPRDIFDRRLRENRMNDGLIKVDSSPTPEQPSIIEETPRILYRKYFPILLEEIKNGELYAFLRDKETNPLTALTEVGKELDRLADVIREDNPAFHEDFSHLPRFREWLIEDIYTRAIEDEVTDGRDFVSIYETKDDAPDWAKRPELNEQLREELFSRDFAVSDELIADGIEDYRSHGTSGDFQDIADFIENEYLMEEAETEFEAEAETEPEPYTPKVGERYEIQGRLYVVDTVDVDWDKVSLRDITFEGNTGFPIFRPETLDFIRMYEPVKSEPQAIQPTEPVSEEIEGIKLKSIVIDLSPSHSVETEETLTPSWEKPKPRTRTNAFDPHPEIPMSERHNYRITDDDLGAGGAKTKYRNNIEAIRTLQAIEAENRYATPEEQEILSRYVGWGGLQEAFDPDKAAWTNEYVELKSLLSDEEYVSARETTLNAHYTSPTVIKAIYKAVENMGFKTGNILEPSCGIGNFLGLVPESMKDSKLFGVELDSLTGRIARQLYQKNSIAIQGYENTNLPDSFFDVAIGNVPFGNYGVSDKRYDKNKFSIHDYFFAKTLDKVRPGGIVAFVTSRFMMDAKNPAVRKYIAQRADLVGAIRLPNNAFQKNAGTEVTTDIIFLQKRDRMIDIEPDWVHLGQTEDEIPVNSYFAEHPDMMLGTMSTESGTRMYGAMNSTSCIPFPDSDLSEQLADAITNIHAEITEYERGEDEPEEDNSIPADPNVRNFSYTLVDGKIYFRQDSRMVPVELPVTTQNRVKGMVALRECVRKLIEYQTEGYPDSDIKAEQVNLNRLYDDFTKKYGLINSRGNSIAFSQDSAYCLLCSLEVLDENGELERKADMFTKRTIKHHEPVTHVDTAVEALAVSMSEKACVDLDYMSELTGQSCEELIKELEGVIFLNIGNAETQDKTYVTADEYLSGNVREKLMMAKAAVAAAPSLEVNVRALEAALPQDLTAAEISVRLGATWLPEDVVQKFVFELLQPSAYARDRIKVHYFTLTGEWNITEKNADRSNIHSFNTYGTQRINAYKIIEETLNLRDVRVFDKVYDENGDEKRVLNKRETAIAQAKQELIRTKFDEWIWKDPNRRERLCRLYNDKFNCIRPREYDGSHIKFPGMNPEIALRKHQIDAIAHIMYGGNTMLAHEVGAGKTYEMVAAAMESKRLGLCSKSLIVVPNHITEQWAAEFLQLYPSANILVATKKDFETKNRKKFCARIATGDYDAVIIGHSQFEKIPMSAERQQAMFRRQINELAEGISEVKRNKGERYTIKQMEKMKKNLTIKLSKLTDQSKKDDVVNFEELGIDRLFIDEAHYYKEL